MIGPQIDNKGTAHIQHETSLPFYKNKKTKKKNRNIITTTLSYIRGLDMFSM